MPPPYKRGDKVAYVELDPEGLRVYRATVQRCGPIEEKGRYAVITDRGFSTVDAQGVGAEVFPIDSLIAHQLHTKGDGHLVEHEQLAHTINQFAERRLKRRDLSQDREPQKDKGRSRGFSY